MFNYFQSISPTGQLFTITFAQWFQIGFCLLTSLVLYFVLRGTLSIIHRLFLKKTSLSFDILESLKKPISSFIATAYIKLSETSIGLTGVAEDVWLKSTNVLFSAVVFWALYCIIDPLSNLMSNFAKKTESDLDDQLVPLIRKTSRVLIVILGFLTLIQNLGINVFSLIAGLGIGGLAIALAAKDTAANFFGSLMILFDQPFKKDDWIKINDIEGTVKETGFRSTRIKTFYDSEVVIPNSTVANSNIDNMGRRQYRRVFTHINLTYSTTTEQISEFNKGVKKIIKEHPNTRKDKLHVNLNSMGESSLDVLLYYFVAVNTYDAELETKEEILFSILKLAKSLNVDFAFPSRSIYMEQNTKD